MAALTDLITYNDKWLTELTSREHRQQVEALAKRLEPMKQELASYPNAEIDITNDGTISTKNLPEEMDVRIRNMNTGIKV